MAAVCLMALISQSSTPSLYTCTHAHSQPHSDASLTLSLSFSHTIPLFYTRTVNGTHLMWWQIRQHCIRACRNMQKNTSLLVTPVLSLPFTNSLYCRFTCSSPPMYTHTNTHTHTFTSFQREGREVEQRFMFWFFLNGNFCSACMFAALPTRAVLQLWNERRNIYLRPQRNTSKSQLAPTYRQSHMFIYTNIKCTAGSAVILLFSHMTPTLSSCSALLCSALKLLAGDRVS